MNGSQSRTKRTILRRRSVTANAPIPSPNHVKTSACDVGTPTVAIIAPDASSHSRGAPIPTTLTPQD